MIAADVNRLFFKRRTKTKTSQYHSMSFFKLEIGLLGPKDAKMIELESPVVPKIMIVLENQIGSENPIVIKGSV